MHVVTVVIRGAAFGLLLLPKLKAKHPVPGTSIRAVMHIHAQAGDAQVEVERVSSIKRHCVARRHEKLIRSGLVAIKQVVACDA